MKNLLLIIDPQNDFCDIPSERASGNVPALPVSGADADMRRLATFIDKGGPQFNAIVATLDSHSMVAIERPGFWMTGTGEAVTPFTQIKRQDVLNGTYVPRNTAVFQEVLAYLEKLEAGNKYTLMVWPAHCVTGTWGHNIHEDVAKALASWEIQTQSQVKKVLKGINPMTEQYSAIRAEVPIAGDESTNTNTALLEQLWAEPARIFVAGEASSHCVKASLLDAVEGIAPELVKNIVVLQDCMSPVSGFEALQTEFFNKCRELRMTVTTSQEALALLG